MDEKFLTELLVSGLSYAAGTGLIHGVAYGPHNPMSWGADMGYRTL